MYKLRPGQIWMYAPTQAQHLHIVTQNWSCNNYASLMQSRLDKKWKQQDAVVLQSNTKFSTGVHRPFIK